VSADVSAAFSTGRHTWSKANKIRSGMNVQTFLCRWIGSLDFPYSRAFIWRCSTVASDYALEYPRASLPPLAMILASGGLTIRAGTN
jgi:hypothetical protein